MTGQQLSYAHGGCETPLIYQTIGARFDEAAARWPDREAFVVCDQGVRLTFAEMKREVDRLAAGLLALGLQPGDRIGIWSPNNAAWVLTQYATAKAGLILVNINPAYRAAELEYALNKVECCALITADAFFQGQRMGVVADDRFCMPCPLYHCGGMVNGSLIGMVHGVTVIYPGEGFDTLAMLRALQDERCTVLGAVPTIFIAMLNHPEFARFDVSRLRKGWIGGAPCPIEIMRRLIDEIGMRDITIIYGMTETAPVSTQTSGDDTIEQRATTVGRVHPHVEIKIVDLEGRTVPRGVQGEICTRGYSVMRGYWNGAEQTAEAIDPARWMHTGDLGTMDEYGYLAITGRSKDMVIRGGENIYPREVEEFLYGHPAVADVQAFGVPDTYYGEELCVWIKLKPGADATEEDIKAFCRGRITHFKIPRYVRFVDSYPMTVTGKIQKFVMREMMTSELSSIQQNAA